MNEIIERALDRADREIAGAHLKGLKADTPLFGEGKAALDSLNLVAFIFILEDEFLKFTGKKLKVSAQEILSREACPFRNLSSLETYLQKKNRELP